MKETLQRLYEKHEMYISNAENLIEYLLNNCRKDDSFVQMTTNVKKYRDNLIQQKYVFEKCLKKESISEEDVNKIEFLVEENENYIKNLKSTIIKP